MKNDHTIQAVRDVRHQISKSVDHHPQKLFRLLPTTKKNGMATVWSAEYLMNRHPTMRMQHSADYAT